MSEPPLVLVGGGKMGAALLGGLVGAGRAPSSLAVVERDAARRAELVRGHPGVTVVESPGEVAATGAVIAVKPSDAEDACRSLAASGTLRRVVSIAAGVRLESLRSWLGGREDVAVLRAMPNTPALVGAAASAVAPGPGAAAADIAWARSILEAVGTVVTVREEDLDAVTGLSGSGPAYVFLLAEALIDAGVAAGLEPAVARDLVVQTLLGSARLLHQTGEPPADLRRAVTSPKGTTEAGVGVLESAGLRVALREAVAAAAERSRELGGPPSGAFSATNAELGDESGR